MERVSPDLLAKLREMHPHNLPCDSCERDARLARRRAFWEKVFSFFYRSTYGRH